MRSYLSKIFSGFFIALSLSVMAYLLFTSSQGDSATTDESTHIVSGYLSLKERDFNINTEHPYLGKQIAALPLIFMNLNLDRTQPYFAVKGDYFYDSWRESRKLGNDFLYKMGNNADKILRSARTMPMIFSLLFALILFFSGMRLFGLSAGLFSLIWYIFSPDILAHSRLANTDLWITVFFFLSVMTFAYYLDKPNWKRLLLSAVFLGLAQIVKFSAAILVPVLLILWIIKYLSNRNKHFLKYLKTGVLVFLIFLVAGWVTVWAGYGFSTYAPPVFKQKLEERYYNQTLIKFYPIIKFLRPAEYFKGWAILNSNTFGDRPSYLFGEMKKGGFWYYFPIVFAVKTPIPTLLLLVFSLIFYVKWKRKLQFNDYLLLIPIALYFLFSMLQKLNIGARHLLPIMPFIFLWIGRFVAELYRRYKNTFYPRLLILSFVSILILWYILGAVRTYPHFLAYFNEFVGPKNGYKVLSDSNIDWGQDIKRLKKWLDLHNVSEPVLVEYFWDGEDALSYYGINWRRLESNNPQQKGYIAVGVTAVNSPEFSWLKQYQPLDQVGYSINIYKVD